MSAGTEVTLACDWLDAEGRVCGLTTVFQGDDWIRQALDAGWGRHDHARNRDRRGDLWFCPTHASIFKSNGGWGYLPLGDAPIAKPKRQRGRWAR